MLSRNPGDDSAELPEFVVEVAEVGALGRASGGVVFRIEIEDDGMAFVIGQAERYLACRRDGKVGEFIVCHGFAPLGRLPAITSAPFSRPAFRRFHCTGDRRQEWCLPARTVRHVQSSANVPS